MAQQTKTLAAGFAPQSYVVGVPVIIRFQRGLRDMQGVHWAPVLRTCKASLLSNTDDFFTKWLSSILASGPRAHRRAKYLTCYHGS